MPYRDLREFLAALRAHDDLIEVDRPVDLYLEIGRALRKAAAIGGPAALFNRNGTAFPLVAGIYNTRAKALLAFEATEANVFDRVMSGLERRIAPVRYEGPAPVHEVVKTGDRIDLREYPVPQYSAEDGGPYITPGFAVSHDPETGVPDIGHYRFQILDATTMSLLAQPFHRLGKHIVKARAMGMKTYEAAVVVGAEPMLAYTCTIQVPDGTDDWQVAGGLRGAPVELVRCTTIAVDVPATAEFVFEIEIDLTKDVIEGPLGEYTGYFTPASMKPLARVKAVTHRRDGIFQALLTGIPPSENHILKQLPFEASFVQQLRKQFPTIERAAIPPSGGVSFYVVMAMRPRYAGEVRQAILAAMATNIRPKIVIVVDPDIDVHNSSDVEWAMSFRTQPQRDAIVVDQLPAGPLDPSVDESVELDRRVASAIGIDATKPFGAQFPAVADYPGWQEYEYPELTRRRAT